jgi:hypothetical protein
VTVATLGENAAAIMTAWSDVLVRGKTDVGRLSAPVDEGEEPIKGADILGVSVY